MRRIPRQIRLDPTFDKRIRAVIADAGGEMTVTDVIHRALADHFRVLDGAPTLDRIASDVAALARRIHEDDSATAAVVRQEKAEVAQLRRQIGELSATVAQLVEEIQGLREKKRGLFS